MLSFAERKEQLVRQVDSAGEGIRLAKDTSNLFRDRHGASERKLDVRQFNHVLAIEPAQGWVDVEGMAPYDALTETTLARGVMPAVVPQLKSITIGGAAAGVGIESTSFKIGLVHDTLLEIEVLTGEGEIVVATPQNEHRELFFGFPNSYGTLGYALRLRARTLPVRRYVHLTHARHRAAEPCFEQIQALAASDIDFLDGVAFAPDELVVTSGRCVDEAPYASDYTFERIYYRSLRERSSDYLTTADYLWRWDTDWFWCSKNLGAQNPLIRRMLGRERLNSRFYTKVMRWNSRIGLTRRLDRLSGLHRETVIQDVDVPLERAGEFLDFFHREIGIAPIWICPIRARQPIGEFALYPLAPGRLYINFGFWDVVRSRQRFSPGHFNRLIEQKVREFGGLKSLYSDSYFTREEFWAAYNGSAYGKLKARYDPRGRFGDLYDKCVLRA
jgi:FAD/FMN-containing dehydrogenase